MKWLLSLLFSFSVAQAAEITLYAINSPYTLNWETPRSLLLSTARSSVNPTRQGHSNHTIGHAYISLKCDYEKAILTGMTSGKGFSSRNNLFNEKHGLSVILQDNPGKLERTEEVSKDIEFYSRFGGRMSALTVEISNDQCLKAKTWFNEFASRPEHIYGGVGRRPLNGEGAGCTAYVMSYFEAADVDYQFFNQLFEQTIYIPNELLGGEFGDRVVPLKNILGNKQKLAVKSENSLEVKLYDPNTMFFWIVNRWQEVKKGKAPADLSNYEASIGLQNQTKILKLKLK